MPIANCLIAPGLEIDAARLDDLIEAWARHSGQSSAHMTVNLVSSAHQLGARYPLMVNLYLPSLWGDQDVQALQTGLARALADTFRCGLDAIHVITSIVESGAVVEGGQTISW